MEKQTKQSQVQQWKESAFKVSEILAESIELLEKQLIDVLREEAESVIGPDDKLKMVPLAENFRMLSERMDVMNVRIQSLTSRLEL